MNLTKKSLINALEQIRVKHNINIDKYIDDVFDNDIPSEALKFINLYMPLKDLGVFNLIYNKRRKTPLYNNFKRGNINNYEKAICLGSLLTQMLCYVKTTKDDVTKHSQLIGANSILEAIDEFVNTGKFDKVNKTYLEISNIFKDLYNKEGE